MHVVDPDAAAGTFFEFFRDNSRHGRQQGSDREFRRSTFLNEETGSWNR